MVDGSTKEAHRSMLGLYTVQMRSGIRISFPVKLRESVNSSHPLGFLYQLFHIFHTIMSDEMKVVVSTLTQYLADIVQRESPLLLQFIDDMFSRVSIITS